MRTASGELASVGPFPGPELFVCAGGCLLQVCRGTVRVNGESEKFALFWPADGEPDAPGPTVLGEAASLEPAGTRAALVRESVEGQVCLEAEPAPEPRAFALAAAAAAMRVSWAWDDTPAIVVAVNGAGFTIAPQFIGGIWQAIEIAGGAV